MDTQDTKPYPYAWHCGALQGFLTMLPCRLYIEGILPTDSLKAAEKFVHENMKRIENEAKQQNANQ